LASTALFGQLRMRSLFPPARPWGIPTAAALALVAALAALTAPPAAADDSKPADPPLCTCPEPPNSPGHWPRPKLADQKLDENDEVAALDAIRVALTEVGDGVTYVWHLRNGRLSGIVRPTASFKDVAGKVCRHIEVTMTTGRQSGRVEGIACRLPDGRWQLDG
jgi:hypothetical protein